MTDAGSACPSDETLTKLARGELGASEARRLDEHVRGCATCRRVLQAVAGVLVTQLQATLATPVARAPSRPLPAPLATPVIDADQHVFTAPADRFVSPQGLVELGRGGLGRVLQVLDRGLEREVAVKEILEVPEDLRAAVERRFIREARLAAQLEHPGIVPVYDLGRGPDGRLFYAMRRIEGTTLAERIDAAKSLSERLALLPNVLTVCQAVAFAHSRGVVHRDIKPQNVMIGAFGETLLLDWGLARAQGEAEQRPLGVDSDDARMTRAGKAVGTPAYLSPEQARGDLAAIDEKSDQWALGALLYQVVTGQPPYADLTVEAVLTKAVLGRVPPVEAEVPQVPRELAAIIARALSPAKIDRYEDVRALARDLTAYLDGRRVAAMDLYNQVIGLQQLADLDRMVGRFAQARVAADEAVAIALELEEKYPGTNDYLEARYEAGMVAAAVARDQGRLEDARLHLAAARTAVETAVATEPANIRYRQVVLRTALHAGDAERVRRAPAAITALPGFDDEPFTYVNGLLFVAQPEEILRELAVHPKLAAGTPGRVVGALAAALAHRPAEALRWIDAELAEPAIFDEWQKGQLAARFVGERGPEIDAVRRLTAELDATEAPRDETRRAKAYRRFADELRALVQDGGAP